MKSLANQVADLARKCDSFELSTIEMLKIIRFDLEKGYLTITNDKENYFEEILRRWEGRLDDLCFKRKDIGALANQVADLVRKCNSFQELGNDVLTTIKLNFERGHLSSTKLNLERMIKSWEE